MVKTHNARPNCPHDEALLVDQNVKPPMTEVVLCCKQICKYKLHDHSYS